MYRAVCPSVHKLSHTLILTETLLPSPASLPVCVFISPPPPSRSLSFVFVLVSALWSFEMSVFWCPAHLYLFVVLIYFSLSPWYSSLSFPFYWVFFLFFIIFLLFRGEMFLQACWGFFVWSAVFSALVSFESTNKLYINLTYPLLAAHEECSSELYTCLISALDICFISKHKTKK